MVTALHATTSAQAKATAPRCGRRRCPCVHRGCVRRCGRNIRLQTPLAPARSGGRPPRASVATRVWESEWARSATGGRNRNRTRPVPARAAPPLGAVCAWCARLRASARPFFSHPLTFLALLWVSGARRFPFGQPIFADGARSEALAPLTAVPNAHAHRAANSNDAALSTRRPRCSPAFPLLSLGEENPRLPSASDGRVVRAADGRRRGHRRVGRVHARAHPPVGRLARHGVSGRPV